MYRTISNLLLMSTMAVCVASVGTLSYRLNHTLEAKWPQSTQSAEKPVLLSGLQAVHRDLKADRFTATKVVDAAPFRQMLVLALTRDEPSFSAYLRRAVNRAHKADSSAIAPAIQIIARAGKSDPADMPVRTRATVRTLAGLASAEPDVADTRLIRVKRQPEGLVFTPVASLDVRWTNVSTEPTAPRASSDVMQN